MPPLFRHCPKPYFSLCSNRWHNYRSSSTNNLQSISNKSLWPLLKDLPNSRLKLHSTLLNPVSLRLRTLPSLAAIETNPNPSFVQYAPSFNSTPVNSLLGMRLDKSSLLLDLSKVVQQELGRTIIRMQCSILKLMIHLQLFKLFRIRLKELSEVLTVLRKHIPIWQL